MSAMVANTGELKGKEVVQVYVKVPQGKLGNPARKLIGFAKTKELEWRAGRGLYCYSEV